jgi:hypothetical protein
MTDEHPEITLDTPAEELLLLDYVERRRVLARLRRDYNRRHPDRPLRNEHNSELHGE